MPSSGRVLALCLILGALATAPIRPADSADRDLERRFTQTIRPFLNQYCAGCHGIATPVAQFDIRPYSTMAAVLADFGHWRLVSEKLNACEMPPQGVPQPPAAVRKEVLAWIQAVAANEASKNAGDSGPVLARRLSNAEYNNTIRDLTGFDIRPAREFPVDPANSAGVDNSGESLMMSPSLFNKYLQAAREVSDHMVLTPDGFDFAPHPMLAVTDRDRYSIQRILDFYAGQPTDYAAYFEAAWRYKYRAARGKPRATLAAIAAESNLSAKYLPMIWNILEAPTVPGIPEAGPVATLQAMWRELPPPAPGDPDMLREMCAEMRDFALRIRSHTSMQFAAPVVRGLPPGSQPLLNWKLREFNMNRRNSDPKALRNDTDPAPEVPPAPRYPGLHQEGAPRWAALMARARANDTDLIVPADERPRYEAAFARFASVFPDGFYVSERGRYFPDDSDDKGRFLSAGYHNVMGFWRDDLPLMELILDQNGQKQLDRLWDEFDFIADHTYRTYEQFYFNQSGAVDTRDPEEGRPRPADKSIDDPSVIFGLRDDYRAKAVEDPKNDPVAVEAIGYHYKWINDTLRRVQQMRLDAQPSHVDALLRFAARAYRRPLTPAEQNDFKTFYRSMRDKDGLSHEDAIRDLIVSVLVSPKFCYRVDLVDSVAPSAVNARPGAQPVRDQRRDLPLSDYALASRLSYFLWASMPDEKLLSAAASGTLHQREVLLAQTRRMLKDPRARGLALEFAGNWLDFRRFETHNAVDRQRFPTFTNDLRQAMFEEPVRVLEDVIRNDRSVLDPIYGNYTFVNAPLAEHYGIPGVTGNASEWVRIDDARRYSRGSLFTMSVFLTQNAPGLRTSPVKRGYWVARRVLGETIPPPPPSVPELPQDEAAMDLPLRDMLARHRSIPACAACHARFDSFGLAFEDYGPVGEHRSKDLAGRPIDNEAVFPGNASVPAGVKGAGFEGLQTYIRQNRQNDYLDNICRKLLSYALNRTLILSDDPLVERMRVQLAANGFRFGTMVESIVASPQMLNRRNADSTPANQVATR